MLKTRLEQETQRLKVNLSLNYYNPSTNLRHTLHDTIPVPEISGARNMKHIMKHKTYKPPHTATIFYHNLTGQVGKHDMAPLGPTHGYWHVLYPASDPGLSNGGGGARNMKYKALQWWPFLWLVLTGQGRHAPPPPIHSCYPNPIDPRRWDKGALACEKIPYMAQGSRVVRTKYLQLYLNVWMIEHVTQCIVGNDFRVRFACVSCSVHVPFAHAHSPQ